MMMRPATVALMLAALGLSGCGTVSKVTIDSARLSQTQPPNARLACAYRLDGLVDARPIGNSAGGVGLKAFALPDAMSVVRDQLAAAGLRSEGEGREVDIRVMQLYLSQNTITLVPVVVYEATVAGHAPMIVRVQPTSMNDWGSDNEATGAYATALRAANAKLIASLNAICPSDSPQSP